VSTVPNIAFFTNLVESQYAASLHTLHPFAASFIDDARAVFQVQLTNGTSWVLRAYQRTRPVPDWLIGCAADTTPAWLASRAATLRYLAQQQYPAPRLVATHTGASIAETDSWCMLMTTFIDGQLTDPTPTTLFGMAAALGRLHHLGRADPATMVRETGKSWWYPTIAIPTALQQYADLADTLPPEWRTTVDAFCATLHVIHTHQDTLPRAIIHGDGWAGNAVQTATRDMIFIDWEPSGQGIAILDLGRLLLQCHQDLATPLTTPIKPTAWRVNAVIEGYCSARMPTVTERAVLLDAIRFGVAFGAATHFTSAKRADWEPRQPERLTRRQRWFAVCERIADLAQKRLDQLL